MTRPQVFLPGSIVGVMGGGQLGRMFAIAARRMGYRVHTFSPDEDTPTGQLADREVAALYDDADAVRDFATGVDVLTFEFENIPRETISLCEPHCTVRPAGSVLEIAQHRLREKEWLRTHGFPLPAFRRIDDSTTIRETLEEWRTDAVLKTAAFGYDGKGQAKVSRTDDVDLLWQKWSGGTAVLEQFVPFTMELSVIVARCPSGAVAVYPVSENRHRNHILDVTVVPAAVDPSVESAARDLAVRIAEAIDLAGILAVELFLLEDGSLLVNELAPRPHNSGHWTFDASVTSQFEQQLRAICNLPLGAPDLLRPCAMANLLGDEWWNGEPRWENLLQDPDVKLHLYGKAAPRPGRKMGHLIAFADSPDAAVSKAAEARARLRQP
jgi:5-(carboxyamino)imidazole ribonucleotide synthase